jgi:hypothetical protein
MSGPIVITGNATRYAQLLAQRGALKLEAQGFKRSGGRSVLSMLRNAELELIDPETGATIETISPIIKSRTAIGAYKELNELIVRLCGEEFRRDLPADLKRIV